MYISASRRCCIAPRLLSVAETGIWIPAMANGFTTLSFLPSSLYEPSSSRGVHCPPQDEHPFVEILLEDHQQQETGTRAINSRSLAVACISSPHGTLFLVRGLRQRTWSRGIPRCPR